MINLSQTRIRPTIKVVLFASGSYGSQMKEKLVVLESDNSTPNVSSGFLNRFLALVRLYEYIYGQFFVIVLF